MTAVPPGNRLPESRSRNPQTDPRRKHPLASECGVTAGSDVVRSRPAGAFPFTYHAWISSQRLGIERAWHDPAVGMAADDQIPARRPPHIRCRRDSANRVGLRRLDMADHAADQPVARFGLGQPAAVNSGIGARTAPRFGARPLCQTFKKDLPEKGAVHRLNNRETFRHPHSHDPLHSRTERPSD